MTKEEKQAVIQKLRQENMKMRADIDRIRSKLANEKEKERQIGVDVEASVLQRCCWCLAFLVGVLA